eukprot:TRINITY_DN9191_c0_g2_i1.p1 TRINITY_DN9191_c0_g2~~TRINITY_DN9191_c0_g2_i1.p1  ORF type:complete len:518 (-),score=88.41 TRINITY_DN9191_c0_g2_i1:45-1562(-)
MRYAVNSSPVVLQQEALPMRRLGVSSSAEQSGMRQQVRLGDMVTEYGSAEVKKTTDTSNGKVSKSAPITTDGGIGADKISRLIGDKQRNAQLAAGKAISYWQKMEFTGSLHVEKGSVYGAAIAIPQIARCAGWGGSYLALVFRTYLFLALNIAIQLYLLTVIGEENHVMANFAGQMHLCDFGAKMEDCPDGPNCKGPRGTTYTPARLYDFDPWSTRVFAHESLKSLFPDREEEIDRIADPGEYGMENWYCRLCCLFIFTTAVWNDLRTTMSLCMLLITSPEQEEKWIVYELPEWHEDKDYAKSVHGWTELDLCQFKVGSMPRSWKFINAASVAAPKCLIWICLVSSGFHFLMETATITNLIINTLALTFVLNLDELIFEAFSTEAVQHMMRRLQDRQLFDHTQEETETDDDVLQRFTQNEIGSRMKAFSQWCLPRRLIIVLLMATLFYAKYLFSNCYRLEDGSWVSQPLLEPESVEYNPIGFLIPSFLRYVKGSVLWQMPEFSDE